MQETQVWSLGWEDPVEKGMAIHSSYSPEVAELDTTEWLTKYIYVFFLDSFPIRLLQSIEQSPLWYTVGPYWLLYK